MDAKEIQSVYDELTKIPAQSANNALADLGNQAAAQGALAGAMNATTGAMNATGSSGISQYTYDRLVSPTVNSLTQQLVVEGKQAALSQAMQDALKAAQNNYNRARSSYASRHARYYSNSGGSSGSSNQSSQSSQSSSYGSVKEEETLGDQLLPMSKDYADQILTKGKYDKEKVVWVNTNTNERGYSKNENGEGGGWVIDQAATDYINEQGGK